MKSLFCIISTILLAGCAGFGPAPQRLSYSGGDGSSCDQAIVINNAKFREACTLGEKIWLEQKYPGYTQTRQSVVRAADKQFDVVQFTTPDGQARSVYFDSTMFATR
jgi:hypothetical protein